MVDSYPYSGQDEEEKLCIRLLNEWEAFEFAEQIEEASGQASGEASLETMLKKVLARGFACIN